MKDFKFESFKSPNLAGQKSSGFNVKQEIAEEEPVSDYEDESHIKMNVQKDLSPDKRVSIEKVITPK